MSDLEIYNKLNLKKYLSFDDFIYIKVITSGYTGLITLPSGKTTYIEPKQCSSREIRESFRSVLDKTEINNISYSKRILKENLNIDICNNDNAYKSMQEILEGMSNKWNSKII